MNEIELDYDTIDFDFRSSVQSIQHLDKYKHSLASISCDKGNKISMIHNNVCWMFL